MQEEIQTEDEISLSDILRALVAKIWVLLAVLIIGGIAGGAFGFLRYYNVHYYGTELTYFVSSTGKEDSDSQTPSDGAITQSYSESILKMVTRLLNSKVFERTLMQDLPQAAGIAQDTEEEEKFFELLEDTVSYTYTVGENTLTVSVSALNDEALASDLLNQIKAKLPSFIQQNMNNNLYGTTYCKLIDWGLCGLLNPGQWLTEGIKYGLLLGLAAFVIGCVVVIVVDRTDDRLRDYRKFSDRIHIPVLGVIPRIDAVSDEMRYGYGSKEAKK